jgi:hypothetical protein
VQSDPIRLRGGLNTYAYVSDAPLLQADPSGLVRWTGAYAMWSVGVAKLGAGYSYFRGSFTLMSDCVNQQKGIASVRVDGSGVGTGISLAGPVSINSGTVTLEDKLSEVNPSVFTGVFAMQSAGVLG